MLEDELRREIEKWSKKLDEKVPEASASDPKGRELLENIRAYRDDSKHFLEAGDLIRSFECLVRAWALLEAGRELGHLE